MGVPGHTGPSAECQEYRRCPSLVSSSLLFILKFLFTSPLRNALLPSAPPVTHSCSHSCWQGPQLMPASSPSFPAPRGPPGDMGGRGRELALSVALWLSWGAALGAVACATALLIQQTELQILRREVAQLRRTGGPSERGEGHPWLSLQEQVSAGRRVSGGKGRWQVLSGTLGPSRMVGSVPSGYQRGSRFWRSREQPLQ